MVDTDATVRIIEVYADTRGYSTCTGRTCGQRLLWAVVVKSGKRMCFNDDAPVLHTRMDLTGREVVTYPFDTNHWAHCPDSATFKHGRRSS